MLIEDGEGGAVASGAAVDYLPERYYWVFADGETQIAKTVWVKRQLKWQTLDGTTRSFVERVIKGPLEVPT